MVKRDITTRVKRDIISYLPDEILHHIISFIPTKHAITTSVLSKRWQHVWTKTPSLSFDSQRTRHDSISKTLRNYSSLKLKSLSLIITFTVPATQTDSWIEFGMSRNPEELCLLLNKPENNYTIPDSFFISSSVKQLTLQFRSSVTVPIRNISWTSLRILTLKCCILPDESIANILASCSMLETLVLNSCNGPFNLDLSKYVNVTRLDIWRTTKAMKIVAPHVRCLSIRNIDYRTSLVDVSSLIKANLDLVCSLLFHGARPVQDNALRMLTKLRNVEELTLGTVVLQILSLLEIRGAPFPQFKVKTLTVETFLVRSVIPGIIRLLQSSPGLKKITIYTKIRGDLMEERELESYLIAQSLNLDRCWGGLFPKAEVCMFEVIATATNTRSEHVASFMEIVLLNAKKLEAMVLRLEGYLSEAEYQRLVPKFPTVSRNENDRKFGQTKAVLNSFKVIP